MKKMRIVASVLAGTLLICAISWGADANLVSGGGMEELKDGIPTGWQKYQHGEKWVMQVVPDEQIKHSGQRSIRLDSAENVRGGIKQENIPLQSGMDYQFQFWARSEGVEGSAEGGAVFLSFDHGPRQHIDLKMLKGTQDWNLVGKKIDVPGDAKNLTIAIELYNAKGKIWIDDVELTALPQSNGIMNPSAKNLLAPPPMSVKAGEGTLNPWQPLIKTDLPLFFVNGKSTPSFGNPLPELDTAVTFQGNPSLRIAAEDVSSGGWLQEIPVVSGKTYDFSIQVKTKDLISDDVGTAVFFVFDKGEKQFINGLNSLKGAGEHGWMEERSTINIPEGATLLKVIPCLYFAKGTAWFSDARLTAHGEIVRANIPPDPLIAISNPLFKELLTNEPQVKPIIATTGCCMEESGTPQNVKQNPRWREDMAEELLSAKINGFLWRAGPYMEFLGEHGFKNLLWIGFNQTGLGVSQPETVFSEENIRNFVEGAKAQVKEARFAAGVLFGDEQEGGFVDIFFNDPDPLKRIAVREANAEKFIEVGRRFYKAVKDLNPALPVISNNLCMIWYPITPLDYSLYGETGDIMSYDAYPTPREAGRKGSAAFMPGFGAKFLSDMTGKPVWGILQAFEYHKNATTPAKVQEEVSQLFRNGGSNLLWYDHTFPAVPGNFVKYQQPDVWDMEKRMSWMAAGLPKIKLPQSSDTAILYSQHSYAAKPGISREYWKKECALGIELYSAYALIGQKVGNWFTFICDRQLERKEKDLNKFKAIYLPLSTYETETVAQQIRDYVKQGGVVVAGDPEVFSSGINGENLSKYREEIFGISLVKKGSQNKAEWNKQVLVFPPNQYSEIVAWNVEVINPNAEILAKFTDGTPALVKNKFGNGTAYYFAANPFCPEVLGDATWIALFKQIQIEATCKIDEPIWNFLIPSDQVSFDKISKIEKQKMPDSLRNGGFEEVESGTIKEWFLSSNSQGKVELDSSNPHGGKYCLKLACEGKANSAAAAQVVSVKPNTDYVLRFWYRFSGGTGPMKVYGLFGKTFWVEKITTEWTPMEFTVNSGAYEEGSINFLQYNRDNTIWIDDIEWEEKGVTK